MITSDEIQKSINDIHKAEKRLRKQRDTAYSDNAKLMQYRAVLNELAKVQINLCNIRDSLIGD